jgi:SAM-dependent methyltransferase
MKHVQRFFSSNGDSYASDNSKPETIQAFSAIPQHASDSRRYREDVPYVLPKDSGEQERLNLQHILFRSLLRGNYAAPLSADITHILDVGSGSGIWGWEVAQQFPAASVLGMDLEPPHILSSPPPNYHFVQGNVLQRFPFPDNTFDFTHQRLLTGGIPTQDWPHVLQELVRVTRPGGWVEIIEYSTLSNAGPATELFYKWMIHLCRSRGIDPSKTEEIGTMLTQAGLKQITQRFLDIPLGASDTQIVNLVQKRNSMLGFVALKPAICTILQLDPIVVDQQLVMAEQEWEEQHSFHRFYLAYGQVSP